MQRPILMTVALLCGAALTLLPVLATAQAGGGQDYTPPRTPWGDPDIQGVFTTDDSMNVPMERPQEFGDRLFLTEEEYAERVGRTRGQAESFAEEFADPSARVTTGSPRHWFELATEDSRQTSRVISPSNGRIPEVTAEGRARGTGGVGNPSNPQSPEDFTLFDRCITRGVTGSILARIYGNGTRILQSPGYVAVINEMVHEARVIPLEPAPYPGESLRMYMGSSRAHWEGSTLVVETRNLTDKTAVTTDSRGQRHSEDLVITERFTRTSPDRVRYEAAFDDPGTWTAPWAIGFDLVQRADYDIYEYGCHEGNKALRNILSGARAAEAAANP